LLLESQALMLPAWIAWQPRVKVPRGWQVARRRLNRLVKLMLEGDLAQVCLANGTCAGMVIGARSDALIRGHLRAGASRRASTRLPGVLLAPARRDWATASIAGSMAHHYYPRRGIMLGAPRVPDSPGGQASLHPSLRPA